MIQAIKKMIPNNMKSEILSFLSSAHDQRWVKYEDINKQRIFIFLAGFYQNLGDMALTYSQTEFLRRLFPDAEVIAVPSTQTYQSIPTIKRIIRPNDLITIIGGGNMDDIYVSLEDARLFVVKSFPNNRIVSFPQTMIFSDTMFGKKRLSKSRCIYSAHKNITLFVRERNSLERIEQAFPGIDIGFCPDIVLSLNKTEPRCERSKILCCMRTDKEQQISDTQRTAICHAIERNYGEVLFKDTVDVELSACQPERYEATLGEFWSLLKQCKVVVTDRLHCMIFCAITGTPCVVMDNSNRKISGVFNEWLSGLDWILMIDGYSEEQVILAVHKLKRGLKQHSVPDLTAQFESLRCACLGRQL